MTIQGVTTAQAESREIPQRDAVTIPESVLNALLAHAREGKPEEICGIVRGKGAQAIEALRAQNIADDRAQNYTVDPQTLLRQFEMEDAGEAMMAIYHSHPAAPAYPSATDAWNATYPDAIYLIVSLEDDANPVVRGWSLVTEDVMPDMTALRDQIAFFEARPGLFGYHQGADAPIPEAMQHTVEPPFYVLYSAKQGDEPEEIRVVSVREHPLEVQEE